MCVMFHSDKNEQNECEVNVGPLSVFETEGIPIMGKVSKSQKWRVYWILKRQVLPR